MLVLVNIYLFSGISGRVLFLRITVQKVQVSSRVPSALVRHFDDHTSQGMLVKECIHEPIRLAQFSFLMLDCVESEYDI